MRTWNLPRNKDVADIFKEDLVCDLAVCQQEGYLALFHTAHLIQLLQILPEFDSAIPAKQETCGDLLVMFCFSCTSLH